MFVINILITFTIIVFCIAIFSIIKTSESINIVKRFFWKKYQEYQYRKIQKEEEAERLIQEEQQRKKAEEEHLERERRRIELLKLEAERQKKEQEERERIKQEQIEEERKRLELLKLEAERQKKEQERQERIRQEQIEEERKRLELLKLEVERQKKEQEERERIKQKHKPIKENKKKYNPNNKKFKCLDGDIVKSKAERDIDNFFSHHKIKHIYEEEYYNVKRQQKTHPDFFLPEYNLYIEYFGMNTPEYNKIKAWKMDLYSAEDHYKFEFIDYKNDYDINDKLKEICKKYKIPLKGE
ncbi:MAG: hypothetical protein E7678_06935 [Ruminococcaceae bacterium]|nr:hypothetical protein [Oscillospiraceae bacterium]